MVEKKIEKDYWNAELYDERHSFVSKYGSSLVEMLNAKKGEKIVDLGCGTGDLANQLFEAGVDIIGIDKSENMIIQAYNKYPHISFSVQDATKLPYKSEFDAVFSNATLHWVKPPKKALLSIFNSLKQGGRFVAEFGGKGNVQTITDEVINQLLKVGIDFREEQFPWFYPSIGEYSSLMEEVGFRVTFAQHFDRPTPLDGENGLRNWVNMFGSQLLEGVDEEKKEMIIAKVEERLKPILYKDGRWIADYKRIRIIGIKE